MAASSRNSRAEAARGPPAQGQERSRQACGPVTVLCMALVTPTLPSVCKYIKNSNLPALSSHGDLLTLQFFALEEQSVLCEVPQLSEASALGPGSTSSSWVHTTLCVQHEGLTRRETSTASSIGTSKFPGSGTRSGPSATTALAMLTHTTQHRGGAPATLQTPHLQQSQAEVTLAPETNTLMLKFLL